MPEDPREIYRKSEVEEDPDIYTIKEIQKDTVTLDGNHPFAGKDLTFEVTIVDITEPSITELETGLPDEYTEDEEDGSDGFDEDFPEDEQNNFGRHWR
jgi:FKBP-type peptidyl-prolyl cis-trans isomerase SlyD